jgi:hypothetical protein
MTEAQFNKERMIFFHIMLEKLDTYMKKNDFDPYLTLYLNIDSGWTIILNGKQINKYPERKYRRESLWSWDRQQLKNTKEINHKMKY